MTSVVALAVIAMLSGCGQSGDTRSSSLVPDASTGRVAQPELSGEWQIAAIDGKTVVGYALEGNDNVLTWKPACAGWSLPYRQNGAAIRFIPKERPPGEMQVVCAVGYPDRLPEIFSMIPALDRIEVVGKTSVRFTGGGHSMLLERPLAANRRPVQSLEGRWSVSNIDGGDLKRGSLRFDMTDYLIVWQPACAAQQRQYVIENSRIVVTRLPNFTAPPGAQTTLPPPVCAIGLHPRLEAAFSAMEAATNVSPTGGGGVTLKGGGHEVTLLPDQG